jgi:hypothetical protein
MVDLKRHASAMADVKAHASAVAELQREVDAKRSLLPELRAHRLQTETMVAPRDLEQLAHASDVLRRAQQLNLVGFGSLARAAEARDAVARGLSATMGLLVEMPDMAERAAAARAMTAYADLSRYIEQLQAAAQSAPWPAAPRSPAPRHKATRRARARGATPASVPREVADAAASTVFRLAPAEAAAARSDPAALLAVLAAVYADARGWISGGHLNADRLIALLGFVTALLSYDLARWTKAHTLAREAAQDGEAAAARRTEAERDAARTTYLATQTLVLREEPDGRALALARVPKDQRFTVRDRVGRWLAVEVRDACTQEVRTGWVNVRHTRLAPPSSDASPAAASCGSP